MEVLSEIHRVLRPGGLFWVDVPNEGGAYFRLGNSYYRLKKRDWVVNLAPTFEPYHVFGYTPRSVRRLVERVGFEVLRLKTPVGAGTEVYTSPIPKRLHSFVHQLLVWSTRFELGTYMDVLAIKR